ncbi:MAG: TRAM domain-containing protein [Gemmatimonadota bacterium]|nr:TRAM domain-containing protein [Gemmatimonadota bacterium]
MTAETVDLRVEGIAVGGSGFGRTESGRVVFVPGSAPGDRLRAELTERRKRWARGRIVELYERGPGRVEPECPHFGRCGACRLMHLDEESQHHALRRGVADTLERIGHVSVPVLPVVGGERRLGYRNRVTFTVRRRGGRVYAGYHEVAGRRLVDVERCPLAEPAVARAWSELRGAWGPGAANLPPGAELRITVRAGAGGDIGVFIVGGRAGGSGDADRRVEEGVATLAEAMSGLATLWWEAGDGTRRHMYGSATLPDRWDACALELGPTAFVQVNREVAGLIESHLDERLGPPAGRGILDLYAGVGLRGLRWTARGGRVRSVEMNPEAIDAARRAAREAGLDLELVQSTVECALEAAAEGVDDIIVNPPRAGLSEEAVLALRGIEATRLVYVSCDPATLARDAARLAGAWSARLAQPFDAFPHTGHVETVLWFERETGGAS